MSEHNFPPPPTATIADNELLEGDEVLVIVDDFPDIVGLLREFLEQRGFPSVTAGSASELRQHLSTRNVALILLDIGLPDADGMQLLPELKKSRPDLAVIMLTAVTDLQTALSASVTGQTTTSPSPSISPICSPPCARCSKSDG